MENNKKIILIVAGTALAIALFFIIKNARKQDEHGESVLAGKLHNIVDKLNKKADPEDLAGETRPIIPAS